MRQCSDMRTSAPSSTKRCLDRTGGGDGKMSTQCTLNWKLATRRCVYGSTVVQEVHPCG